MKIIIKKYLPNYYTATAYINPLNLSYPTIANGFGSTHTKALNDLMATIKRLNIIKI